MEGRGVTTVPIYPPPLPEMDERHPEHQGNVARLWLLWNERRLFWGVAWKTFVLAVAVSFLLPKHYEAVVKVVPGENTSSGMMGLPGKLANLGGSGVGSGISLALDATGLLGGKTPTAFYVEILKSRSLQDRIIDHFNLRVRYWKTGRWWPRSYYDTRKKLTSFTDIEEDKKSNVITVKVTDYKPDTAAQIANAYIAELNREAAGLNTGEAHRERVFLEGRLKEAKQDLDRTALALSQYSSKNTIMNPQDQGRAMMDAAARVEGEIIADEAELRGLQQIYSDDNIRVRTLNARLETLREKLHSMAGKQPQPPSADYPSMSTLPILGYRYSDLYRQTKIQEAIYEFLTQQYETAKIDEAKELPSVRVMDPAVPPEKKSGPHRILIWICGVLGAMVLTTCWVLGKNSWEGMPAHDSRRLLAAEVSAEVRRGIGKLMGRRS
ncbi:MAG TPA: Wzz/FepE/Etk N-terminal domain-containing protein [Candidatus Angelobacter sp.]|nr:Wzz/FepE/Etk N-terminal domain-containing protein [Candidatus Angelobacter sp.]